MAVDEATAARLLGGNGLATVEHLRLYECEGVGHGAHPILDLFVAGSTGDGLDEPLGLLLGPAPAGESTGKVPGEVMPSPAARVVANEKCGRG